MYKMKPKDGSRPITFTGRINKNRYSQQKCISCENLTNDVKKETNASLLVVLEKSIFLSTIRTFNLRGLPSIIGPSMPTALPSTENLAPPLF
jgi:hypothetical protein